MFKRNLTASLSIFGILVVVLLTLLSVEAQDLSRMSDSGAVGRFRTERAGMALKLKGQGAGEPNYLDPNFVDSNDVNDISDETESWSSIELLLSGRAPNEVSLELRQYGYDVFQRKVTTFAPVTNVPVGFDYTVGPGDRFAITVWGRHNDQMTVTVGRDGKIVLPEVGGVAVAGMSFGDLQGFIESKLKQKYSDIKMHISMERLRTITVYVVGEAEIPGNYTISALSTALHALFAAGGPTKNGSLRKIQVIRAGKMERIVDVYDLLMKGDTRSDIRLVDGDMIHIPLIGPVVGVAGNVRRPAIYEMKEAFSLGEVLELAGGVTHAGWLQHVQVDRVERHMRRTVVDFDLSVDPGTDRSLATPLYDGDVVKVFPVLEREEGIVFLDGHVVRPMRFQLYAGMGLADVIKDHRLLAPYVNMEYAQIERLVPPDMRRAVIPFHLGRLLAGESSENEPLQDLDTIRLFQWDEVGKRSVVVSGMVHDPNEYPYVAEMRVKDLVDTAGGLDKNAYLKEAEITRRHITQDGMRTEGITVNLGRAMQYDPAHNILLQDYDQLVVRPIPEIDLGETIVIEGEVRFPGEYPIREGERLSSVIERAGGFTAEAYHRGAVFTRVSAQMVQEQRLQQLIQELEKSVLTEASEGVSKSADAEAAEMQKAALESKQELLEKMRTAEVSGRVVIRLSSLDAFKDSAYDLELEDGDELMIPRTPGIVSVVGEVFNATSLLYEDNQSVKYYLNRVGGITKDADKKQISVVRADGSVISNAQRKGRRITWNSQTRQWGSGGFMNTPLAPGDTIVVPRKLDRIFWLKNTKDITQIIFQMALAVGVVLAL